MRTVVSSKSKGKVIFMFLGLLLVVVVLSAVLIFFLYSGPRSFLEDTVGPPPSDPETRKQWLAEKIKPMDKTLLVIDEKLPSWKELKQMNKSLGAKRNYPKFIKATQTYGTLPNLVEVLYFSDTLKYLGVNTQFVHANYWFKKGEFEFWYQDFKNARLLNQDESKRALVYNIMLAKKQGLAVILFPDYFELENGGMARLNISNDLEKRLEIIALEIAQIAEEYNVEYLVPVNQIEMLFESNGYDIKEAQQRTNAFYASVVPKIRKIYTGKIMYKMGGFQRWSNYDGISLKGADIFGFTGCYDHNRDDVDRVVMDIKESATQANKLSTKYGVPWFNAEFVVSNENSHRSNNSTFRIENYYRAGLAAFNKHAVPAGAKGFTVHSLLSSGQVYGTPAMSMIKKFFADH